MILPETAGIFRECSDVPEMAEAGVSLCGANFTATDEFTCVSSVSRALLVAGSYCIVCCLASAYQSHFESIPRASESVTFLNPDMVFHRIELDVIDHSLYSS